jgi:hypothetical protein
MPITRGEERLLVSLIADTFRGFDHRGDRLALLRTVVDMSSPPPPPPPPIPAESRPELTPELESWINGLNDIAPAVSGISEPTADEYARFGKLVMLKLGANAEWNSAADYLDLFAQMAEDVFGVGITDPDTRDFWRELADLEGIEHDGE